MKPQVNDIVLVTGSMSIPEEFLGSYGRITAVSGNKVNLQIKERNNDIEGLSYVAYIDDLQKVGKITI
jgi:hypothetical protein